jgi:Cytosol aminopeptidase family, catalytic domain
MNGKTVEVDNTDAEGRLVLSGWYFPRNHIFGRLNMNRCYLLYVDGIQTSLID